MCQWLTLYTALMHILPVMASKQNVKQMYQHPKHSKECSCALEMEKVGCTKQESLSMQKDSSSK